MYDLDKTYTKSFFKMRPRLSWRIPIVCNAIITVLHPSSVIDVGCGCAGYVKGFLDRGLLAVGIEGSENCLPFLMVEKYQIYILDIRKPFDISEEHGYKSDLAMCFEVAEHIEAEYVNIFIQNLKKLSNEILITAAPPGQGGLKHVNCQPKEYWVEKMKMIGSRYDYDDEYTELIKSKFTHLHRREIKVYHDNIMFFRKVKS